MTLQLDLHPLFLAFLASLRAGVLLLFLPVVGGELLPARIRVFLSLALGFVLAPAAAPALPMDAAGVLVAVGREFAIGATLGFFCRLLLVAPTMSGDIIAQELGIRMAQEVDPTTRMPTTAMGRLFESTFFLLFLGLNGHHDVIRSLHASYTSFPVAGTRLPGTLPELVTGLQLCVRHAILIAAPLMGILLIFSVVLALLAKSVPQVNLMNFGVSLRMLGGFIAAVLVFPLLQRPLLDLLGSLRGALDSVAGG